MMIKQKSKKNYKNISLQFLSKTLTLAMFDNTFHGNKDLEYNPLFILLQVKPHRTVCSRISGRVILRSVVLVEELYLHTSNHQTLNVGRTFLCF